jgi:hypothetical protein
MFHQLMLRHIAGRRNRNTPVYIELEAPGRDTRLTGGLYLGQHPKIYQKVLAVNTVQSGHWQQEPQHDGIVYKGTEEFQIPYQELERINAFYRWQPGTRIFRGDSVFRVIDSQFLDNERTYLVQTERTTDPVPSFTSAWNFENDIVGAYPAGWIVTDPNESDVAVAQGGFGNSGNYVEITNSIASEHMGMAVPLLDHVAGPPIFFKWRNLITGITDTSGITGFDFVGDNNDILDLSGPAAYAGWIQPEIDGVYYHGIIPGPTSPFIWKMEQDEWYTFEVTLDMGNNLFKVEMTRESTSDKQTYQTTYDGVDLDEISPAYYLGFFAAFLGGVLGKPGTRLVDDVEVSLTA